MKIINFFLLILFLIIFSNLKSADIPSNISDNLEIARISTIKGFCAKHSNGIEMYKKRYLKLQGEIDQWGKINRQTIDIACKEYLAIIYTMIGMSGLEFGTQNFQIIENILGKVWNSIDEIANATVYFDSQFCKECVSFQKNIHKKYFDLFNRYKKIINDYSWYKIVEKIKVKS